jgi:hypothetical protein
MRSHLISQAILKQFTDKSGKLSVFDKLTAQEDLRIPYDVSYKNLDDAIIRETEQLWSNSIEKEATKLLNTIKDGGVLFFEKHEKTIKALMALHFVRSEVIFILIEQQSRAHRQDIETSMVRDFPEHAAVIKRRLDSDWNNLVGQTLTEIIEENRIKVNNYLDTHGLEIGIAPDDTQLIIGDCPAIPISDDGRMGVLNGVAILEAKSFAMPFTPKHLIAAKSSPETKRYITLTSAEVLAANSKQKQNAIRYYYSKPKEQ